jgi:hypothetical protein
MSRTRPYRIWINMQRRCHDPADKDWANYGGRGIEVCPQWRASFEDFWADMAVGYSPLLTLDRADNSLGYCPENCRWGTARMQANNRRGNVRIETPRGVLTIAEAAREFGLKPITLRARISRGDPDPLRRVR